SSAASDVYKRQASITFTGSPKVGIGIKQKAGLKRVTLELGSNAAETTVSYTHLRAHETKENIVSPHQHEKKKGAGGGGG
ncbi:aldehyde dehydrogenase family protein, partial [Bacillus cereus]|uniref:aldehyde dehydrogenase family protein n=1 Tax=Bacillus cereus TaxID=1396 RepID=UPI001F5B49D3